MSRLSRGITRMSPGTVGGQSRIATPVKKLTIRKSTRLVPVNDTDDEDV